MIGDAPAPCTPILYYVYITIIDWPRVGGKHHLSSPPFLMVGNTPCAVAVSLAAGSCSWPSGSCSWPCSWPSGSCSGSCSWPSGYLSGDPILADGHLSDHPMPQPRDIWCTAVIVAVFRLIPTLGSMQLIHAALHVDHDTTVSWSNRAPGCGCSTASRRAPGRDRPGRWYRTQNPHAIPPVRVRPHRRGWGRNVLARRLRAGTITTITTQGRGSGILLFVPGRREPSPPSPHPDFAIFALTMVEEGSIPRRLTLQQE
jgi:hypothetical protein